MAQPQRKSLLLQHLLKCSCAWHLCLNIVNGCLGGDVKAKKAAAPAAVDRLFRGDDRAQVPSSWAENPEATGTGRVEVAQFVGFQSSRAARLMGRELDENTALGKGSVIFDRLDADVFAAGIGNIQQVLLGAECDAARTLAFFGNLFQWVNSGNLRPGNVVDRGLVGSLADVPNFATGHVAEVDRAVDTVDQIAGRTQSFAFVPVCQNSNRAILFSAGYPACLTCQQPALMIEGQSIGAVGRLAKDAEPTSRGFFLPGRNGPFVNLLAAQVAEQQKPNTAEDSPPGEAKTTCHLDDPGPSFHQIKQASVIGINSWCSQSQDPLPCA